MARKKVLLVEDDFDTRFAVMRWLEASGYRCTCTGDVRRAMEILKESVPDVILLDLGLRGVDGTAVLRHLREWLPVGSKPPPVMVLSGHKEKEVVDYCLANGALEFIPKPFDPIHLLERIHCHVA